MTMDYGLKLSVLKSCLFQTSVKWCERITDGNGVRHDPERIKTLQQLPHPQIDEEIQQFLCAVNWLRDSLIGCAYNARPLQACLNRALSNHKRSKRVAAGIKIDLIADERQVCDKRCDTCSCGHGCI